MPDATVMIFAVRSPYDGKNPDPVRVAVEWADGAGAVRLTQAELRDRIASKPAYTIADCSTKLLGAPRPPGSPRYTDPGANSHPPGVGLLLRLQPTAARPVDVEFPFILYGWAPGVADDKLAQADARTNLAELNSHLNDQWQVKCWEPLHEDPAEGLTIVLVRLGKHLV